MPKPLRPTWSGALQVTGTGPFKKVKQKWPVEVYSWEDLLQQVVEKCAPFVPGFEDRVYVRNTDVDKDAIMMEHAVYSFSYFVSAPSRPACARCPADPALLRLCLCAYPFARRTKSSTRTSTSVPMTMLSCWAGSTASC